MRSKILKAMAFAMFLPVLIFAGPGREMKAVPPSGFFAGDALYMKCHFGSPEGDEWTYFGIRDGDNNVPATLFSSCYFVPMAAYGPPLQVGPPLRLWSGRYELYKFIGSSWVVICGDNLTFNAAGASFADNQLPSPSISEGDAPGIYRLKFLNIKFWENGVLQDVTENYMTMTFEVVAVP